MMADFRAAFSAGVDLEVWEDPALGQVPSRINPDPEHQHSRHVGSVGTQIAISATVGGVLAPLDGALGGRLFSAFIAESPTPTPFAVSSPAGQSSVQRFTPPAVGHYSLRFVREGGGSIFFHVDVQ